MGSQTAKGYPYPLGTDRAMDGDDAIKALAEAVDGKAGVTASGSVTIATPTTGTAASVAITFPVGRFTQAPMVMVAHANLAASTGNYAPPSTSGVTTSGTNIWACRTGGSTPSVEVRWFAHQIN